MWLLDKMLRKVITRGELVVTDHDGKIYRYGAPDPAIRSVHARLTEIGEIRGRCLALGGSERLLNGVHRIEAEHGNQVER